MAAPANAAAKTKARTHSLVGTVVKVDGQTLTVKTGSGEQSVMLAPSTHITQNGKTIQASQLSSETGARVKVRYTDANGQKQAQMVTVSPAAKVAKK
jgi:hypothetical protein